MPLSKCRICGKRVPNPYRQHHEKVTCLKMRKLRGDQDMLMRELPKVTKPKEETLPKGQHRLLEWKNQTK